MNSASALSSSLRPCLFCPLFAIMASAASLLPNCGVFCPASPKILASVFFIQLLDDHEVGAFFLAFSRTWCLCLFSSCLWILSVCVFFPAVSGSWWLWLFPGFLNNLASVSFFQLSLDLDVCVLFFQLSESLRQCISPSIYGYWRLYFFQFVFRSWRLCIFFSCLCILASVSFVAVSPSWGLCLFPGRSVQIFGMPSEFVTMRKSGLNFLESSDN